MLRRTLVGVVFRMKRFIFLSFILLGLGFYELSGGADFDPEATRAAVLDDRQARAARRTPDKTTSRTEAVVAPAETPVGAAARAEPTENNAAQAPAPLNLVPFAVVTRPEPPAPERRAAPLPVPETRPSPPVATVTGIPVTGLTGSVEGGLARFSGSQISSTPEDTGPTSDIRTVKGTRVNLRSGPGTDYDVVDQLTQSTKVEILSDSGNGWVELRPVDGGPTGWIAAFLLTDG